MNTPVFGAKAIELSRYFRTTWMFNAQTELKIGGESFIRFLGTQETAELANQVRKRNVFARHSWENNFYLKRIQDLGEHTVIEFYLPGDPAEIGDVAQETADFLEKLVSLSSIIALSKIDLQRRLGISAKLRTEMEFIIGPQFRFLRSRTKSSRLAKGIVIDRQFAKRFARCGFDKLTNYVMANSGLSERVLKSLNWLFESRLKPRLASSVVKTAIALESLFIFSESESLAQTLSERMAFVLSTDPRMRQQISRVLKRFYDARSGVVHGSQKKAKNLTPSLLETVDRLSVLSYLVIAANSHLWPSLENFREWCESQRWGAPSSELKSPFPRLYLQNALRLIGKDIGLDKA
jgi:hypothetical protein